MLTKNKPTFDPDKYQQAMEKVYEEVYKGNDVVMSSRPDGGYDVTSRVRGTD